jgi:hypothetical protein
MRKSLGIILLVAAAFAIACDAWSSIISAISLSRNPNLHSISTFPAGLICAIPLFWFGRRAVLSNLHQVPKPPTPRLSDSN